MKRRPLYFFSLLIAASYTALLFIVGSLSISPYIAQLHPDSLRDLLGAFMDRIYPFVSLPIRPLGLLGALDISIPAGFDIPVVFLYIFLLSCIAALLVRTLRRHALNVA
jgi:hypothetical protein